MSIDVWEKISVKEYDWSTSDDSPLWQIFREVEGEGGSRLERETLPRASNGSGNSSRVLKCKSCSVSGKVDIL